MDIKAFFDEATSTLTYLVFDDATRDAVIIDPLLDFDAASGRIASKSVDAVLAFARSARLEVHMTLETHAHADHLSAAQHVKAAFPRAQLATSAQVTAVQRRFQPVYALEGELAPDGSQFDRLLGDFERVAAGSLRFEVRPIPGHTEACAAYVFEGAVFVGDTLFMPDYGTGRCDFPGGSAERLYDSVTGQLYSLPETTRVFTAHDYLPNGRPLRFEATIGEQKRENIQLPAGRPRAEFCDFRRLRDAMLATPRLLHPSVQVNIAGGRLPKPDCAGRSFLKIPVNTAEN